MEDEKKTQDPYALVADSMSKLFGGLGCDRKPASHRAVKKPITETFRIVAVILREDGAAAANISIGMMGTETTTAKANLNL
jgi:hypothetical protein